MKKTPDSGTTLWGRVAAGVEPLSGRHKNLNRRHDGPPPTDRKRHQATANTDLPGDLPAPAPRRPALPELDHRSSPGLDKSTAARLKKGRRPIEARLDLHGMIQAEARPALDSFVEHAYRAGKRNVLVITGKGAKPDGSVGILRQAVPRWLNLPPNRARILAFSYATPKDGGEGALYVLLKRKR